MASPAPLTVVIPTLNEASQIGDCVRGLSWTSEVIVVDAGSKDGTVASARAAGARVLDAAEPGIAAQRNAGIAVAKNEWVFALDADERIGPALATELAAVVIAPRHEAYRVKRRNVFHGEVLRRGHWRIRGSSCPPPRLPPSGHSPMSWTTRPTGTWDITWIRLSCMVASGQPSSRPRAGVRHLAMWRYGPRFDSGATTSCTAASSTAAWG